MNQVNDAINPNHYKTESGLECIEIAELFPYTQGNAIKYAWRAGQKDNLVQDLKKCEWYIDRAMSEDTSTLCFDAYDKLQEKFFESNANYIIGLKVEFNSYPLQSALISALVTDNLFIAKIIVSYLIKTMENKE